MRKQIFIVVVACVLLSGCLAKIFKKCELAKALEDAGMERPDIRNFVCIAEFGSDFYTEQIEDQGKGNKEYGLFQINKKYFCGDDFGQNLCNMTCADLLDATLEDDVDCIKVIIAERESWDGMGTGLQAWETYIDDCQDRNMTEYMHECWSNPKNTP